MDKFGEKDKALSFDAFEEIYKTGTTSIVCPRCGAKPEFKMSITPLTKRLERVLGGCKCGYLCLYAIS